MNQRATPRKGPDFSVPEVGTLGLPAGWDPEIEHRPPILDPHGFLLAKGLGRPFPFALYCDKSKEAPGGRPSAGDEMEPARLAGG